MTIVPRFARFLIHPVAVPSTAWNSTLGWNRQLTRIHPDARLRQSAGLLLLQLNLQGPIPNIRSALIYLNDLDLEIWHENLDQDGGW